MDVPMNSDVKIPAGAATLDGSLTLPHGATVLVLFVCGSGSSRHSPRNQFVARTLNGSGLATLLFDLLTPDEETVDMRTAEHRFDISLLAERLVHATHWAMDHESTRHLRLGYFGSSHGAGGPRSWLRQNCLAMSAPSSPAAAGPISRATRCHSCKPRRFSSWAATTMS